MLAALAAFLAYGIIVTLVFLVLLYLLLMVICRLYIEPIKGVCKSDAKLHGQVALVTGGNSGIGLETARDLARRGAKVIIACRNAQRSEEAIDDIVRTTGNSDVHYTYLDLSKFKSVREFAEDFNKRYDELHILVNNAGCVGLPARPSEDGIDLVMQVNYFGPFLLTNLLLDKLIASKPSRIVIVSSYGHHVARRFNVDTLETPGRIHYFMKYANSKLCDVLWMKALAKRLPEGVTVNALHPGVVDTDIVRNGSNAIKILAKWTARSLFKTAAEGAQTTIYLCVAPELEGVTGEYFQDCALADVADKAKNDKIIEDVWKKSLFLTQSNWDLKSK